MPDEPDKKKVIGVPLDEELHRKARLKSVRTGQSIAGICRQAVEQWVEEPNGEKNGKKS